MKKIKLLMPFLGIATLTTALVPVFTTSCSNNTNLVELAQGQSATKEASNSTTRVTYRFVQKNISNPESTKVKITDFKVNDVDSTIWAKTFTYAADSAGNIVFHINTANIIKSVSNEIHTISFNLQFVNDKANTNRLFGPLTINFAEEKAQEITVEGDVTMTKLWEESNGLITTYKIAATDSSKYVNSLTISSPETDVDLVEGLDYTATIVSSKYYNNNVGIVSIMTTKSIKIVADTGDTRGDCVDCYYKTTDDLTSTTTSQRLKLDVDEGADNIPKIDFASANYIQFGFQKNQTYASQYLYGNSASSYYDLSNITSQSKTTTLNINTSTRFPMYFYTQGFATSDPLISFIYEIQNQSKQTTYHGSFILQINNVPQHEEGDI